MSNVWTPLASKLNVELAKDGEFFSLTHAASVVFAVACADNASDGILVDVQGRQGNIAALGQGAKPEFTLLANTQQWVEFLKPLPKMPFQSYFGMFGMNVNQKGVCVDGDKQKFVRFAHLWRRLLEVARYAQNGSVVETDQDDIETEDVLTGHYVWTDIPNWGRTKLFYDQAGEGKRDVLFLHTAGSDSRQYHGVMNDPRARARCNMVAVDLPGHGRSFPVLGEQPGQHELTEAKYLGFIKAVIDKLKLNKPIVCGASMAGEVCLNVAMYPEEIGAGGVIPCQGADYVDMALPDWCRDPTINQSLFNPEWIIGMISPTTSQRRKREIWWMYSAQGWGIFHGDLIYYFRGFDGRDRVGKIDTKKCPVVMLTGEYDWSCTPALSQATAKKIAGAHCKIMPGLGHFPATEAPKKFVPHFLDAVDIIEAELA